MKKLLVGLIGVWLLSSAAFAQMPPMAQVPPRLSISPPMMAPPALPRTVTVSGEAQEDFAPDQAILSISLTNKDKNLHTAKQHNDEMVERLVSITEKLDIPKEKVATSDVVIAPQYDWDNGQQYFKGYMVSRGVRITMDNLDTPEKLLSAVVDAKIDQVNGLEYRLANPESHAKPLRLKAFSGAKAKAEALAQASGSKLGRALSISTEGDMPSWPARPMPMMAAAMRASEQSVAPSLPGMVELQETVQVMFELE